jgi:hypothetical protein
MGSEAKMKECLHSRGVIVGSADVIGCNVAVNKIDPRGDAKPQFADVVNFQAFRYAKRENCQPKGYKGTAVDSSVVAMAHYY